MGAMLVFGVADVLWYASPDKKRAGNWAHWGVGLYTILMGLLVNPLEFKWGTIRPLNISKIPIRTVAYTLIALPQFLSVPSVISGFFTLCVGVVDAIAVCRGEINDGPPLRLARKKVRRKQE